MERLDFVLPDFTRLSWASDQAREVWEPRMRRIGNAWFQIEWRSIVDGVRECAITVASPQDLIDRAGEWAKYGLSGLPVQLQGLTNASYSSTSVPWQQGQPFVFRVVAGTPESVTEFKSAWDVGDDVTIGRLLGYPPCCTAFFKEVWVDRHMVDTTWPMAANTLAQTNGADVLEVGGPAESNILWRWMGMRAVPHLPCRFDCPATVKLGTALMDVGRQAGFEEEMEWLHEILSWSAEWSALHGIAEIKTPVLKVSTRTDATAKKYVVRRQGEKYPAEGARGLGFPYSQPRQPLVTLSPGFRRGLDNPVPPHKPAPAWYASDNGFSSQFAMDSAHRPIVELANAVLSTGGGNVLDLGCGNGALLQKLYEANPTIEPFGIDHDASRVAHARELLADFGNHFMTGDLCDDDEPWRGERRYRLALLMPGRLVEAGAERASKLLERLEFQCDRVLVYAYGDWLAKYKNLAGLARKAGMVVLGTAEKAPASLAGIRSERPARSKA